MCEWAAPYLQRCGQRRHAVQAEAPRRAPRPGDRLRPGLLPITTLSISVLPPGAHAAAGEDDNPQRQARHGTAARGQHLSLFPASSRRRGCCGNKRGTRRGGGSKLMEVHFNKNYYSRGRSKRDRGVHTRAGSGCGEVFKTQSLHSTCSLCSLNSRYMEREKNQWQGGMFAQSQSSPG